MNTTQTNETAQQALDRNMRAIESQLATLRALAGAKFGAPSTPHWGHVGTAAHISELLDNAIQFAQGYPNER